MALAGGPMKTRPAAGTGLGKVFVLAQKAVAGVDGLRARGLGRVDDALPAQVAVLGRAAANVHGLVADGHVLGLGVGIGIHGDGLHAQALGSRGHSAGDLAAIGDRYLFEHCALLRRDRLRTLRVPYDLSKRLLSNRFHHGLQSESF